MFFYLAYKLTGQPPDIWHDPNAIGLMSLGIGLAAIVIGAVVAIAIGIYQVRQSRTPGKLVYQILSKAPLVSVNSDMTDQVEIDVRVKGTPVKDARLLIVDIKNVGKVSIHSSDYFEPLTFEFKTKVLQASVLETTPPTLINSSVLPTFLMLTSQSVQFPTFPLNPGDTIQISILLEGKGAPKVRGRLDQGTITEFKPEKKRFLIVPDAAIPLITLGASIAGAAIAVGVSIVTGVDIITALIFVIMAILVAIAALLIVLRITQPKW